MDPFYFGCLVFGGGATMMGLHWDKRFRERQANHSDEESAYHESQYHRRMLASGMITLVGILFMIYRFLPQQSVIRVWWIAAVLLIVGGIVVIGLFDFSSITRLFAIQQKKSADAARVLAEELKEMRRQAELKKANSSQLDDQPSGGDPPEDPAP